MTNNGDHVRTCNPVPHRGGEKVVLPKNALRPSQRCKPVVAAQ